MVGVPIVPDWYQAAQFKDPSNNEQVEADKFKGTQIIFGRGKPDESLYSKFSAIVSPVPALA